MQKSTANDQRRLNSPQNAPLQTVRRDGKRFIPEEILAWEEGNKNTRLEISKSSNPLFGPFRVLIVDKSGEVLFQAAGEDFSDVKQQLKGKQKLIPRGLKIEGGITYFNRLIWGNCSKNSIIRIKTKNGNGGNRRKKKTKYIYAEIITINGTLMAEFKAATKTAIKVAIRSNPMIPNGLCIEDTETYFNRIKQANN